MHIKYSLIYMTFFICENLKYRHASESLEDYFFLVSHNSLITYFKSSIASSSLVESIEAMCFQQHVFLCTVASIDKLERKFSRHNY